MVTAWLFGSGGDNPGLWMRWPGSLAVLLLWVTVLGSVAAAERQVPPSSDEQHAIDMGAGDVAGRTLRPGAAVDEATKREFAEKYAAAGRSKRTTFDKYLDALGANALLDFLEAKYPFCHSQAHELGQAIFARLRALAPALEMCQTRCTSGCMHGVLMEAFGHSPEAAGSATDQHITLHEVEKQMVALCREQGEMAKMHKPGNCAHGMGHALMVVAGQDVEQSLGACAAFKRPPMEYYCATGVFMEYFGSAARENGDPGDLHAPCDIYTRFPAACYRYRAREMLTLLKGDLSAVVAECLKLSPRQQLGCFHGVGDAAVSRVARRPRVLAEVCRHGTPEDQALCIEGAIEKLADINESKALAACRGLGGRNAALCRSAAAEKMYRLDKPTMKLYYAERFP